MLSEWRLESSVTKAAICMGWKRQGCEQSTGHIQSGSQIGNKHRDAETTAENQRGISMHKIEIDWRKRGLEPSGPSLPARWPANKVAQVMCGCMIVT